MEFTVIGEPTEPEGVRKCTGEKMARPLKIKPDISGNREREKSITDHNGA